jgi:ATP-dependent helicase HepA
VRRRGNLLAITTFAAGQRWISNTESELGLGIVDACGERSVTINFPAAQERRTYAMDNAPLTRVLYPVGELINTGDGESLRISARTEHGALLRYTGVSADGHSRTIEEAELDSFARFSRPQDRLLAGQVDPNGHFALRVQTLAHRHRHTCSNVFGLLGGRVALLPHQLHIASTVGARHAPRVLLADEVGLGKTIEAGLIVHQQLVTGRASRVLFVVPDTLVHQWLVEMLRRFNLRLTILDEQRCEALESADDGNPFESAQLALCPLSVLVDQPDRLQQAAGAGWDLLVVDEAHHLQWSEQQASPAYRSIEALARNVAGLLLLTATPEQLGAEGHFARLRLLDPDRYHDAASFREEEAGYQSISELVQQLLDGATLVETPDADAVVARVEAYLGPEAAGTLRLRPDDDESQAAIRRVVRTLLDRHGTGRVLFRNTRSAVGGFMPRRLVAHRLREATEDEPSDAGALARMREPLRAMGEDWVRSDPRVAWLEGLLRDAGGTRALVICARADTARALEEHLRTRAGIRSAVFHEGMGLLARDRAAAYFAEPTADGAQVLVCSEIGSEGRNFQHASALVLFDLPLDPELLEQRIGRLDRIGQQHEVVIHVPYQDTAPSQVLLRWYHEGLDAFESPCAIGERMRERFAGRLAACLDSPEEQHLLDGLVSDTRCAARETLLEFEQGRDRLLELGSCDHVQAAKTLQALVDGSRSTTLRSYMEALFDLFGVEHEADGAHATVIRAGQHMICDQFPELPEDGLSATFERKQALAREDMAFLTWEHPMVSGAMGMLLDGGIGNATLCTLDRLPLKAGTLLLEAIFVMHCPGPRALGLNRFTATDMVRQVVTGDGQELTSAIPAQAIELRVAEVPEEVAGELLRHAWPDIERLVSLAQKLATRDQAALVEGAVQRATTHHDLELERLRALAAVNPNIRAEEIEHMESQAAMVHSHLAAAQLRLDAIRVGLVT